MSNDWGDEQGTHQGGWGWAGEHRWAATYVQLWRDTRREDDYPAFPSDYLRALVSLAERHGWRDLEAARVLCYPEREAEEVGSSAAEGLARALRAALPSLAPDNNRTADMARDLADFAARGPFLVQLEEY